MYNEPRVYKFLLPSLVLVLLIPLGLWVNMVAERNAWAWFGWCNYAVFGAMPILALQAFAGFRAYYRRLAVDDFVAKRQAEIMTPQIRLAETMKQMHPAAINILSMYGRSTWMLMPGAKADKDDAIWILYGTQVTSSFIVDFLKSSTVTACVPMYKFANDGAKLHAPHNMRSSWCSDREQYSQFVNYLFGRGIVTMAHGNLPAEFIAPWNPENVARSFGFELYEEEAVSN